jgi:iron uptake system EfeUOB component EfeO/EfeM
MRAIVLAIPLMLTAVPGYAQQTASPMKQQTRAFAEAFNSGDVELLSTMYTDTAMVLPRTAKCPRAVRRSRAIGGPP